MPIPGGMFDGSYSISAHLEDRAGGPFVLFETPTANRTSIEFTLECSDDLASGAIVNFILRDA